MGPRDRKAKEKDPAASVDKMVLLVDEYDKPLLGHLGKPDVCEIRDALKDFYSVIKMRNLSDRRIEVVPQGEAH